MRYEHDPFYALVIIPIFAAFYFLLKDRMPRRLFNFLGVFLFWSPLYIGLFLNERPLTGLVVLGVSFALWWSIKDDT